VVSASCGQLLGTLGNEARAVGRNPLGTLMVLAGVQCLRSCRNHSVSRAQQHGNIFCFLRPLVRSRFVFSSQADTHSGGIRTSLTIDARLSRGRLLDKDDFVQHHHHTYKLCLRWQPVPLPEPCVTVFPQIYLLVMPDERLGLILRALSHAIV